MKYTYAEPPAPDVPFEKMGRIARLKDWWKNRKTLTPGFTPRNTAIAFIGTAAVSTLIMAVIPPLTPAMPILGASLLAKAGMGAAFSALWTGGFGGFILAQEYANMRKRVTWETESGQRVESNLMVKFNLQSGQKRINDLVAQKEHARNDKDAAQIEEKIRKVADEFNAYAKGATIIAPQQPDETFRFTRRVRSFQPV